MYSYLLRGEAVEDFVFYTYTHIQPMKLRGPPPLLVRAGTRFGVRPASDNRTMIFILADDPTRTISISHVEADLLARGLSL